MRFENRRADGPTPLSRGLNDALRRLGAPPVGAFDQVLDAWHGVVVEPLRSLARPERLDGTTLVIVVPDPLLARDLDWRSADILADLNDRLPDLPIEEIRVRVERA